MSGEDIMARRLLIEQTRKELLARIRQYQVGWCSNGEIIATKDSGDWNGYLFVIPDDEYKSIFND